MCVDICMCCGDGSKRDSSGRAVDTVQVGPQLTAHGLSLR